MKRVIVESPFRACDDRTQEFHTWLVHLLCRTVALRGDQPIASHLVGPEFLSEHVPSEREIGISIMRAWLPVAEEVQFYDRWGMTGGMKGCETLVAEVNLRRFSDATTYQRVSGGVSLISILRYSRGETPWWNDLDARIDHYLAAIR